MRSEYTFNYDCLFQASRTSSSWWPFGSRHPEEGTSTSKDAPIAGAATTTTQEVTNASLTTAAAAGNSNELDEDATTPTNDPKGLVGGGEAASSEPDHVAPDLPNAGGVLPDQDLGTVSRRTSEGDSEGDQMPKKMYKKTLRLSSDVVVSSDNRYSTYTKNIMKLRPFLLLIFFCRKR